MEYFTPSIEDIRVGYECFWIKDHTKEFDGDNLIPFIFSAKRLAAILFPPINWERENTDNIGPNLGSYIVPYLTKEQIEAEGWKEGDTYYKTLEKANDYATYFCAFMDDHKIRISEYTKTNPDEVWRMQRRSIVFEGECKDINTFRYICKLLKI